MSAQNPVLPAYVASWHFSEVRLDVSGDRFRIQSGLGQAPIGAWRTASSMPPSSALAPTPCDGRHKGPCDAGHMPPAEGGLGFWLKIEPAPMDDLIDKGTSGGRKQGRRQ